MASGGLLKIFPEGRSRRDFTGRIVIAHLGLIHSPPLKIVEV
jgi:hypothetical protein